MFNIIRTALSGKKAYIVAFWMILYGVLGVYFKTMTPEQAMQFVLNGMGISALRAGINKQ